LPPCCRIVSGIVVQGRRSAKGLTYNRHFIIMRETAYRIDVLEFLLANAELPVQIAKLIER